MPEDIGTGIADEFDDEFGKIKSESNFFQYEEGQYTAIVGRLIAKYKDADGEKCERSKPGAKMAFIMQEMFIMKSPYGDPLNDDATLNKDLPAGACRYQKYVSIKPDQQWGNVLFYKDFKIDGQPTLDVVTKEGNDEFVNYAIIGRYYLGARVTFKMTMSKKKSLFPEEVELVTHALNNASLKENKALADIIISNVEARIQEEKDAREAAKENESSTPVADVPSEDATQNLVDNLID